MVQYKSAHQSQLKFDPNKQQIILTEEPVKLVWDGNSAEGLASVFAALSTEPNVYLKIKCPDCPEELGSHRVESFSIRESIANSKQA